MPTAKLELSIGKLSFSGEGDEQWLAAQLDKLLIHADNSAGSSTDADDELAGDESKQTPDGANVPTGTLAAFLTATKAGSSQVQRFLATAEWLHRKGKKEIKTSDITKAITDNQQKRLGNPADSLNKNVSKGHCEKMGSGSFYVTDEGRTQLGFK